MRIGVLGTARITQAALLEPAAQLGDVEVAAVASRDPGRAAAFAERHGIERVHRSYAELVADDSLDAVYNPLPASAHASWSLRALEAGRHVLVEKPFARNAPEARAMVAAARDADRLLVEAFHWRYHPLAQRMIEVAGLLGPLRRGEAVFRAHITDRSDIRHSLALGGGATMDLGCYAVHWLRTISGEEPVVTGASAEIGAAGVDVSLEATLAFPSGLQAVVRSSMDAPEGPPERWLRVVGDLGELHVDNPCAPHFGHRVVASLADGTELDEVVPGRTTYAHQLEAFRAAIASGAPALTGDDDAVRNMAVIDAMYVAAGLQPR